MLTKSRKKTTLLIIAKSQGRSGRFCLLRTFAKTHVFQHINAFAAIYSLASQSYHLERISKNMAKRFILIIRGRFGAQEPRLAAFGAQKAAVGAQGSALNALECKWAEVLSGNQKAELHVPPFERSFEGRLKFCFLSPCNVSPNH
jgi:hypothetical protein